MLEARDRRALLDAVDEFVEGALAPRAGEIDETNRFPEDVVSAMAKMGLFGLFIPEEYGGARLDVRVGLLNGSRGCVLLRA